MDWDVLLWDLVTELLQNLFDELLRIVVLHHLYLECVTVRLHFVKLATSVVFQDLRGRQNLLHLPQHFLKMVLIQLIWALLEHLQIFVYLLWVIDYAIERSHMLMRIISLHGLFHLLPEMFLFLLDNTWHVLCVQIYLRLSLILYQYQSYIFLLEAVDRILFQRTPSQMVIDHIFKCDWLLAFTKLL